MTSIIGGSSLSTSSSTTTLLSSSQPPPQPQASSSSSSSYFAASPQIQRLLIFHLNFYETCMNGKSLGEGASIQELSEQILYYHFDPRLLVASNNASNDNNDSNNGIGNNSGMVGSGSETSTLTLTEEAVQFLGLCTALLTLPSSLGDKDLASDRSKEIYFGNSTLVFTCLESSDDLVAVAQIPRLYQNGTKVDSAGGNPLAVRRSIERCHRLFCILRNGGILSRLKQQSSVSKLIKKTFNDKKDEEASASSSCPYGGMDQLFQLHKELRHIQQHAQANARKHGRTDNENDRVDIEERISSLQRKIRSFRKKLPILSIRRDLDAHYKEYLSEMSIVSSRNGGTNRCLVETIPVPISQSSGNHVIESSPSMYNGYIAVTLGLKIRRLLRTVSSSLIGISTFYQSQHVYSHLSPVQMIRTDDGVQIDASSETYTLPNEIPCTLMTYMAGYRTKMDHLAGNSQNNNSSSAGVAATATTSSQTGRLGIQQLTLDAISDQGTKLTSPTHLNVGDNNFFSNSAAAGTTTTAAPSSSSLPSSSSGYFMTVPPDFMFSANEFANHIQTQKQDKVWAPRICLPLQKLEKTTKKTKNNEQQQPQTSNDSIPLQQQQQQQQKYFVKGQVLLLEINEFSFLIYLSENCSLHHHHTEKKNHGGNNTEKSVLLTRTLIDVEDTIYQTIATYYERENYHTEEESTTSTLVQNNAVFGNSNDNDDSWIGPGQDLIIVYREEQQLILYSDRSRQIVENEGKKRASSAAATAAAGTGKSPSRRFWNFGLSKSGNSNRTTNDNSSSKHQQTTGNNSSTSRNPILEWSALGLDCRHLLSSHLHLDIILAFDDMMNEVERMKLSNSILRPSVCPLELCTCMPLGWVYAYTNGDVEIYAFFDSSIYVTVADVQNATLKIKQKCYVTWQHPKGTPS